MVQRQTPIKTPELLPKALVPLLDLNSASENIPTSPDHAINETTETQEPAKISETQETPQTEPISTTFTLELHQNLQSSTDKLLFIQFTPANTLRPKWYLVQVQMDQHTQDDAPGTYFCTFLQKHTRDAQLPDNISRWWADWRELEWTNEDSYEYGRRILFQPRNKPDPRKYGKFGLDIDLAEPDRILVGPFDFLEKSTNRPGKSMIPNTAWADLGERCRSTSLTPPLLSQSTRNMINLASHTLTRITIATNPHKKPVPISQTSSLNISHLFDNAFSNDPA